MIGNKMPAGKNPQEMLEELSAITQHIAQQRNAAMDVAANLSGQLSMAYARISKMEEQLAALAVPKSEENPAKG